MVVAISILVLRLPEVYLSLTEDLQFCRRAVVDVKL